MNDEEATIEVGVLHVTSRRDQKLHATEQKSHVVPGMRVTLKILSNANVASRWVELGRDVDQNITDARQRVDQHERRMSKLYIGCTKGQAYNFQTVFADACREHTRHRINLEVHLESARRAATSFNSIAPSEVRREGFIGSQLLRRFDRPRPWHGLAPTKDSQ